MVRLVNEALGKIKGGGVALASELFDLGAAGVGELEEAANFVEGLACGVIASCAKLLVVAKAPDADEQGMSARNDEAEVAGDGVGVVKEGAEKVSFHVVDAVKGTSGGEGEAFRIAEADEQRAGEARAAGGGEVRDLIEGDIGLGEGLGHERREGQGVIAAGDLGNDPAVATMNRDLGGNEGTQDLGTTVRGALEQGDGGFVTGAFDSEEHDRFGEKVRVKGDHSTGASISVPHDGQNFTLLRLIFAPFRQCGHR